MLICKWYLIIVAMLSIGTAEASIVQIDFEPLNNGDVITNQLSGLSFTNAMVLSAGVGLNEFEFPPRSGSNVVFDNGGAIVIEFASPVIAVGGFFTYATHLSVSAYDAAHVLIGSVVSSFSNNLTLSGDAGSQPNEFLEIASATPIAELLILGDPSGSSFVMDDFTYTTDVKVNDVPEPNVFRLVLIALGILTLLERRRSERYWEIEEQCS